MTVQVMLQLRAPFPALFTGSKRERAAKNRGILRLASSPKAEARGSNPLGCAKIRHFLRFSRYLHWRLCKLCQSYAYWRGFA